MSMFIRRAGGFTLIEVAVVLGIVMMLLSLGLTAIGSQLSSASYTITKKRQDAIKDALIGYFGSNSRLPCPYVPVAGTAVTGIAPSETAAVPPVCPQTLGSIPFATLGLAREVGEDGWGNLFSYQVYAVPVAGGCPGTAADWANSACFGAGKRGGIVVNDGTVVSPATMTSSVVAVVVSHGVNGLGAWVAALGTRNANPVTCEEAHNALIGTVPGCTLTSNTYYKGESQANDDVVAYLTATDLLQPLVKQGAIISAAAQVNTDLQSLYDQALGNKVANIGVSPPTPTGCGSTALIGLPAIIDPWGNPYVVAEQGVGGFPICVCSGNSAVITSATTTCTTTVSPVSVIPVCKSIPKSAFNSYIARSGFTACL